MKEIILSMSLLATLTSCAQTPSVSHQPAPSAAPQAQVSSVPGPNLVRNGAIEDNEKEAAPWSLTLHSHSQNLLPIMSVAPAPADKHREYWIGPKKPEGGRALEISLPGPWNVVRVLQEIPEGATRSTYQLEGFVRVSKEFEGSIQAIVSAKAGLSIYANTKRAWFNVKRPESAFVHYVQWWQKFALELPCADEGKTTFVLLIEGKGQVWIDDIELRRQ